MTTQEATLVKDHGVLPSAGQPPAPDQRGGSRTLPVGGSRYPSGRRRVNRGHDSSMTLWQRLRNVGAMQEVGHVVGRLFFCGELTEVQAAAALRYADIVGRYHRYHNEGRRTAASPAYQRGWGHDNEIEMHTKNGTVKDYEKRANEARKQYNRLQKHIPNALARAVMDDLCIHEIEVSPMVRKDAIIILNRIAIEFGAGREEKK
jgi:hypothetical protein